MKTVLYKIFYVVAGCALGVAAFSLPLVPVELSKQTHGWLNSGSGEIVMTVVFFLFVITGGIIGYRKCLRIIREDRMSYRRSLAVLFVSIALSAGIIWLGQMYIAKNLIACGDCISPEQEAVKFNTPESVCQYIQEDRELRNFKKPVKFGFKQCENYECSAKDATAENAILPSWEVSYRCPGPASFRLGQIYLMQVNKVTGSVEIWGATN